MKSNAQPFHWPRADEALSFTEPPRDREDQRPGEVGGGVGEDVRRVRDRDALRRRVGHVEVVVAHGDVRDHLQRGARIHRGAIDAVAEEDDEPGLACEPLVQFRGREPAFAVVHVDVGDRLEQRDRRPGQAAGNEDGGASHRHQDSPGRRERRRYAARRPTIASWNPCLSTRRCRTCRRRSRRTAPQWSRRRPGAGKTTRIPPALVGAGRVILLQPRRVAARATARRMADERGWTIGGEVGWHIRFERRFGPSTRLVVATEGVLTGLMQADPLLSDFRTVVLDEFHERSLHVDLALALARQAWLARDDLRIVVMSATIDAGPIAEYLGGCPHIHVPGRQHPLAIEYAPGEQVPDRAWIEAAAGGSVLAFLPGAGEIRRAQEQLAAPAAAAGIGVVPLHGSLEGAAQDEALRPSARPRIVLATNIAETTLTVPDVSVVVDGGLQKTARYDADRGIDSLETERIPRDAADQRAGRAARLAPGRAVRLWDPRDRLRPAREPEIARVDLAGAVLALVAWNADPARFEWFTAPDPSRIEAALDLLRQLEAVSGRTITPLGRVLQRFPLHPRVARILVEARGAPEAALACAQIGERNVFARHPAATACDLVSDPRVAGGDHAARRPRRARARIAGRARPRPRPPGPDRRRGAPPIAARRLPRPSRAAPGAAVAAGPDGRRQRGDDRR